jgi:hypothetical protein
MRRLILLLSVGWLPPYLGPSGAGLALGTRVCCSRLTPVRVTPDRGCASADARRQPSGLGAIAIRQRALEGHGNLLGNGPHTSHQLTGTSHHHWVGMFAAGDQAAIALAQPVLGLPADSLNGFGLGFQPQLEVSTDVGWVAGRPDALDQGPTGMGMASFGD